MADINLDEVRELLQGKSREETLAYVRKLLPVNKAKKGMHPHSEHAKPTLYTTVVKVYTCKACGTKFNQRYNIPAEEEIGVLDAQGRFSIVRVTGKPGEVIVPSIISKCHNCACKVKIWSRQELELRFLALLKATTVREVAIYNLTMTSVLKDEVEYEEAYHRIQCGEEGCDSPYCACKQYALAL